MTGEVADADATVKEKRMASEHCGAGSALAGSERA